MEINEVLKYMSDYGMIFLGVIIFLEYLNLPGFPAGIILPVAGVWAASTGVGFIVPLAVSVGAAVVASWVLYIVGLYGGTILINKYIKKFPKQKETIEKQLDYLREKGCIGVFISKLVPVVRTIISIPAGVLKLNFWSYTIFSALGILIWNGVLMGTGYFFGEQILERLM